MKPLVVYVAAEYPPKSQTFVCNEAIGVQASGLEVLLFAIDCTSTRSSSLSILRRTFRPRLSDLRLLFRAFANAVRGRRELANILFLPPRNVRQLARSCKALLLSVSLVIQVSRVMHQNSRVHFHGHFFGLMSQVALLAACLAGNKATCSVMGHAGDVANAPSVRRIRYEALRANFVACASKFVESNLLKIESSLSSVVVHCGISPSSLTTSLASLNPPLTIVSVARLVEKKGLDDLIRAVAELVLSNNSVRLIIAGGGPLRGELEDLARGLLIDHVVEFRGPVAPKDVRTLLIEEAHVFALPCKVARNGDSDGIPVAIMEAMAVGVPVVSTPVGGIAELVRHEETGYLVCPGDPSMLAKWLMVAGGRDRHLIDAGKLEVLREFNLYLEADKLRDEILRCSSTRSER